MKFRTEVSPLPRLKGTVKHNEPILLVGSCFADGVGARLEASLFDVCVNPFGPLYNPLSIGKALDALADGVQLQPDELFEHDGSWHSFLFHSSFSHAEPQQALARMNHSLRVAAGFLRDAAVVIITLGTDKVFSHSDFGVVANCHKLPSASFTTRHLTLEESTQALHDIVATVRRVNPTATIMFTVSPLRYIENGLHANQLSKARLLLAVDSVVDDGILYFPAYEAVVDDLRDYRFYAEDMRHPSPQAVDYVFRLFADSFFDDGTAALAEAGSSFTRFMGHRDDSPEAMNRKQTFLRNFTAEWPALARAAQRFFENHLPK